MKKTFHKRDVRHLSTINSFIAISNNKNDKKFLYSIASHFFVWISNRREERRTFLTWKIHQMSFEQNRNVYDDFQHLFSFYFHSLSSIHELRRENWEWKNMLKGKKNVKIRMRESISSLILNFFFNRRYFVNEIRNSYYFLIILYVFTVAICLTWNFW